MALFLLSVGYKKILHFLRLDSKELDCIQAVFFKAFFRMDFSCRGELFQNTPYFIKKKFKIKFKHTILKVKEPVINTSLTQSFL
ncbi:hypothetical protein BTM440_07420 [Helicobacter pylori]